MLDVGDLVIHSIQLPLLHHALLDYGEQPLYDRHEVDISLLLPVLIVLSYSSYDEGTYLNCTAPWGSSPQFVREYLQHPPGHPYLCVTLHNHSGDWSHSRASELMPVCEL